MSCGVAEARQIARDEGGAPNQLINVAVAENLPALRPEQALGSRAARADRPRILETVARIGQGSSLRGRGTAWVDVRTSGSFSE